MSSDVEGNMHRGLWESCGRPAQYVQRVCSTWAGEQALSELSS